MDRASPRKSHRGPRKSPVWDESPEDVGWRVQERPMDNEVTIAEQLVSEGNEQADREQRMVAGVGDAEVEP